VGDLARDAAIDAEWPTTGERYLDFVTHLRIKNASEFARGALAWAWQEYEQATTES
jgi:hypothetical protein